MSLSQTKWKNLLSGDSRLPTDVTFKVVDKFSGSTRVFPAHKPLLAVVSDAFAVQFYGPLKEEKDEIELTFTTVAAAAAFFMFIYEDEEFKMRDMKAVDLFELLNLAEMFLMKELFKKVRNAIGNVKIDLKNVIEMARVAERYKVIFKGGDKLEERCAEFLSTNITGFASLQQFFNGDGKDLADDVELLVRLVMRAKQSDSPAKDRFSESANSDSDDDDDDDAWLGRGRCEHCKCLVPSIILREHQQECWMRVSPPAEKRMRKIPKKKN